MIPRSHLGAGRRPVPQLKPTATATAAVAAIVVGLAPAAAPAAVSVDFEKDIFPIFEHSCLDCHQAPMVRNGRLRKPKGGLQLDSAAGIRKGGDNGEVVKPGQPEESSLYILTTLDPESDEIMPAKGDPLEKRQTDLIKQWIAEGAEFGDWVGAESAPVPDAGTTPPATVDEPGGTPPPPAAPNRWDELAKGLNPASDEVISRVAADTGAIITPIAEGSPLLRVEFVARESSVGDSEVMKLVPLRNYITELNLARTGVTDSSMKNVAMLKLLTKLDLNNTAVTSRGLSQLRSLSNLYYLNLYGTEVDDYGVSNLKDFPKLEEVYLWGSKVTSGGIRRNSSALGSIKVSY